MPVQLIQLDVNGTLYSLSVKPNQTLLEVLREQLGLTGTKEGCSTGSCGACTVQVDGRAVLSCTLLAVAVEGLKIVTIEGVAAGQQLHPVQQAFVEQGAIQCGFCTPGMVMAAKALLEGNPEPSVDEIKTGLDGNLCRCTGYVKIITAVQAASQQTGKSKA